MIELTDEYKKSAKLYKECFGYGVPLRMIPQTVDTAELIEQLDFCVEHREDTLLKYFGVSESNDVLY